MRALAESLDGLVGGARPPFVGGKGGNPGIFPSPAARTRPNPLFRDSPRKNIMPQHKSKVKHFSGKSSILI